MKIMQTDRPEPPNGLEIDELKLVAGQAADAAGHILRKYFRSELILKTKDAPSPVVTEADVEAETAMRKIISAAYPDHTIIGEELGEEPRKGNGDSTITWVLDPLDGTIAFVCGKPTFVSLIGVWNSEPLLGMIDQPILGERWTGGKATPTELNGRACATSGISALGETRLGTTDPVHLRGNGDQLWFENLRQGARLTSCGGDGYAFGLLASGHIDLVVEDGLAWHDAAALIPIVEGAGGAISDFDGQPLLPGQESYQVIAAASRGLLEEALSLRAA